MGKVLDDYLLGLPGFLLNLYFIGELNSNLKLLLQIIFTVLYLVCYPWLLVKRPALRRTWKLDQFNQPYLQRKAHPTSKKQDDDLYDLENSPNANASENRELVGLTGLVSLVGVFIKRWMLQLIAEFWLLLIYIAKK